MTLAVFGSVVLGGTASGLLAVAMARRCRTASNRGSYDASDTATKRGGGTSSPRNRSALTTGLRSTSDIGALADTLVSVRPHPCGGRIAIVRMLQPASELADDDLQAAYAYPAERTWARLNVVASLDGGTADAAGRDVDDPGPQCGPAGSGLTGRDSGSAGEVEGDHGVGDPGGVGGVSRPAADTRFESSKHGRIV